MTILVCFMLAASGGNLDRLTGEIAASGQVVSVQVGYDPGWTASSGGKPLTIRPDALGMMVIEPAGAGPCHIALEFTGGPQRGILLGISVTTLVGLCLWAVSSFFRTARSGRRP